jgi:hypothetical protein
MMPLMRPAMRQDASFMVNDACFMMTDDSFMRKDAAQAKCERSQVTYHAAQYCRASASRKY